MPSVRGWNDGAGWGRSGPVSALRGRGRLGSKRPGIDVGNLPLRRGPALAPSTILRTRIEQGTVMTRRTASEVTTPGALLAALVAGLMGVVLMAPLTGSAAPGRAAPAIGGC